MPTTRASTSLAPSGFGLRAVIVLATLAVTLAVAGPARADGDPASDYLVSQRLFIPDDATQSFDPQQQQLDDLLVRAKRAGYEIRVALIASRYDLGSVTTLMGKPRQYARLLGQELASVYRGRLLIVMPSGMGFNYPGHNDQREARLVAQTDINGGDVSLARSAITAIRRLAAAADITLPPPSSRVGGDAIDDARRIVLIGSATVAALLLLFGCLAARSRWHAQLKHRDLHVDPDLGDHPTK